MWPVFNLNNYNYCSRPWTVRATHPLLSSWLQAVAGMAWGTHSCPKVDKILGPGNQYVTAAKMLLQNSEAMVRRWKSSMGAGGTVQQPALKQLCWGTCCGNVAFAGSWLECFTWSSLPSRIAATTLQRLWPARLCFNVWRLSVDRCAFRPGGWLSQHLR